MADDQALKGIVHVVLSGPGGEVKHEEVIDNVITDAGDLYYATRAIAGVGPASPADATPVTGMKLGSGTTGEAKSGAGAAIVSYIAGSGQAFDAGFPVVDDVTGSGVNADYKVTYAAGTATHAAITEATIVTDATTNDANGSSAADTIARVVFSAVNKTSADELTVTWSHTFNGAL